MAHAIEVDLILGLLLRGLLLGRLRSTGLPSGRGEGHGFGGTTSETEITSTSSRLAVRDVPEGPPPGRLGPARSLGYGNVRVDMLGRTKGLPGR